MFKCDQLIYIQMQKTGCLHIASLLADLFDGQQIGYHNAATQDQLASNEYFISSIRSPWDWYLSLWTYGVQGNGGLMQRLTKKKRLRALASTLVNPKRGFANISRESSKDVAFWRDVYDSSENIESFRTWLRSIHDPSNSRFMDEGYADTTITSLCGLMTYRYLGLCCRNASQLNDPEAIFDYTDLVRFENDNCYIDFFIRQEALEDTLCEAVERVRPLTKEERERIYAAKKTNTSKRSLPISDYYDKQSIEIVRNRDRLLIDKFDYAPPPTAEQGAAPDEDSAKLHTPR